MLRGAVGGAGEWFGLLLIYIVMRVAFAQLYIHELSSTYPLANQRSSADKRNV
jgi:hypothetical protein